MGNIASAQNSAKNCRSSACALALVENSQVYGKHSSTDSVQTYGTRRREMLETIAVVLVVLWLLGFVTSYTMGGFIHILLVLAVVVILIRLIQGRRL
jgi:hypothetical protein